MTVVDCHAHIGRNEHVNYSVDQLLSSMDKAEIDQALVFACDFNDCPNEFLLKEVSSHKDRLHAVLAYHPETSNFVNLGPLKSFLETGNAVAVKVYLGYDHWYPSDKRIYWLLEYTSKLGIPVIFHSGDCLNSVKNAKLKYAHPLGIDEVAVDFPEQKIVIAHMGYPWQRDAAEVVYKNKNVFVDISGFVYGGFGMKNENTFRKVIEDFVEVAGGTDQMLFGTDSPISDQDDYVLVASKLLPESIFFDNPKKVFNL